MRIDIITIFPNMFAPVFNESILKRAQKKGRVKIHIHNLRDYTLDKHRKVDDRPFGGGSGMVLSPGPIFRAVESIMQNAKCKNKNDKSKLKSGAPRTKVWGPLPKAEISSANIHPRVKATGISAEGIKNSKVILLCPQGKKLKQGIAKRLAGYRQLILICGHYEGVDERVRRHLADEELSIGDYVLTGGELPAMVLVDSIVRLLPEVLGDKNSLNFESFEGNLLEYPHYTRPAIFRNLGVPPVLLSGNHKKILEWRKKQAIAKTKRRRPDLLK